MSRKIQAEKETVLRELEKDIRDMRRDILAEFEDLAKVSDRPDKLARHELEELKQSLYNAQKSEKPEPSRILGRAFAYAFAGIPAEKIFDKLRIAEDEYFRLVFVDAVAMGQAAKYLEERSAVVKNKRETGEGAYFSTTLNETYFLTALKSAKFIELKHDEKYDVRVSKAMFNAALQWAEEQGYTHADRTGRDRYEYVISRGFTIKGKTFGDEARSTFNKFAPKFGRMNRDWNRFIEAEQNVKNALASAVGHPEK